MPGLLDALSQTWPARLAQDVWGAAKLPGEVYAGRVDPLSPQAIAGMNTLAGTMMGGGMPMAQKGAVGIFGGRLATTANKGTLARAEQMAAQGADKYKIWNETGWFQGADNKWRFEISDLGSTMKGSGSIAQMTADKGNTVGSVLFHPELFAAYPSLSKMELHGGAGIGRGGYHRDLLGEGAMIRIGPDARDPRSTLLHELQHAVQELEGFAPGASPIGLRPKTPAWDIYQERLAAIRDSGKISREEFSKQAGYEGLAPEKDYLLFLKQTKNISPTVDRAAQEYAVQEAYRRAAGEVEARNVSSRRNLNEEQRRVMPPWTTEDIPTLRQLLGLRKGEQGT